jgi:hypothetical protein
LPRPIPRNASLALTVIGVVATVVLALAPVRAEFANSPLVRLHELDPDLTPPAGTASCGSPLFHLTVSASGPGLVQLARADACQDAARRRVTEAFAVGLVFGLWGLMTRLKPIEKRVTAVGSGDAQAVRHRRQRRAPAKEREDVEAPAP